MNRRSRLGYGFGRNAFQAGAIVEKDGAASALGLIAAKRIDEMGAGLLGPFGIGLDQAAGGDGSDLDDRAHDDQVIVALRRGELDIGILAGLDTAAERHERRQCEKKRCPAHEPASPQSPRDLAQDTEKTRNIVT